MSAVLLVPRPAARQFTPVDIAPELSVGQDAVSRMAQHRDPLLSTLRRTIEAMGGRDLPAATKGPRTGHSSQDMNPRPSSKPLRSSEAAD